ncbi:glycosyl transferase family 1 [Campylobacter troglodytis]|nr:glycosyl transferase family 1 [Campylobacter troglodytis]
MTLSLSCEAIQSIQRLDEGLKLGIHIHIFYVDMIDLFVSYLKNSPFEFDLFISVNLEEHKALCEEKFKTLPKLKNLLVKITPNVGRDLAPFLIAFKDEFKNYDLICHIHSKKTPHDESLSGWANYLLRNLISKEAMGNIIVNFLKDEKIGLVFPLVYDKAFPFVLDLIDKDKENMQALLDRMGIKCTPTKHNFIFPAGTMFWARPTALQSLFELGLSYGDFPKEPIGSATTIAHALERLFGIVAENSGYKIKCFVTRCDLVDSFFSNYTVQARLREAKTRHLELKFFGFKIAKIRQKDYAKIARFLPLSIERLQ